MTKIEYPLVYHLGVPVNPNYVHPASTSTGHPQIWKSELIILPSMPENNYSGGFLSLLRASSLYFLAVASNTYGHNTGLKMTGHIPFIHSRNVLNPYGSVLLFVSLASFW